MTAAALIGIAILALLAVVIGEARDLRPRRAPWKQDSGGRHRRRASDCTRDLQLTGS